MKERGIIFSGDNPKLILDGRKTHSRRLTGLDEVNINPDEWKLMGQNLADDFIFESKIEPGERAIIPCPYGVAGDRLYVREKFRISEVSRPFSTRYCVVQFGDNTQEYRYDCDHPALDLDTLEKDAPKKWRPSIHMPRWASRITLEILKVRVERLQDISDEDVKAEGIGVAGRPARYVQFRMLWDSLHGKGAWDKNPWVWVIEFRKAASQVPNTLDSACTSPLTQIPPRPAVEAEGKKEHEA